MLLEPSPTNLGKNNWLVVHKQRCHKRVVLTRASGCDNQLPLDEYLDEIELPTIAKLVVDSPRATRHPGPIHNIN
jgi:hypothetical protein